jgi:hypothetical protein
MAYFTEPVNNQPTNVSTVKKTLRRCEECDRETNDWVIFLHPDNSEHFRCWSCQQREDKKYNIKPGFRLERSGGRYLPKSPRFN